MRKRCCGGVTQKEECFINSIQEKKVGHELVKGKKEKHETNRETYHNRRLCFVCRGEMKQEDFAMGKTIIQRGGVKGESTKGDDIAPCDTRTFEGGGP